jgi:hypothetical protein
MPDNGIGLACRTRLSRETTDKLALAGGYVYRLIAIGDLEVLGDAQSCAVLSELAEYEASGEPFVSILSRGDHGTWGGFQFMELSFEVQIIAERRRSFSTQNPDVTQRFVPSQIRREILPLVAKQYSAILEMFRPGFVYRGCAQPNLPENALEKHRFLTKAIIGCGYYMYRGEPMSSVTGFGYAGRLIDKARTKMHGILKFLERLKAMALLKRSDSLASYRSRAAHGETYQMSKESAQSLVRKLKEDKKRRAEKKQRAPEHA